MPSEGDGSAGASALWARSGAMWLTGRPGGRPLPVPGAPAESVASQLAEIGPAAPDVTLLGERAALAGLTRRGDVSAGGAARLLPTKDGWLAISLPRADDLRLLPALVEGAVDQPWVDLARWLVRHDGADALERTRLLGLAAAPVPAAPEPPRRPGVRCLLGGARPRGGPPLVIDLSALWAGPLCAHLLGLRGAHVVKVESLHRPDGARRGEPRFYDLLHAGHRSVALDLTGGSGQAALGRLVDRADVVIEASRPRALRQLGIVAERAAERGAVWVSITAYGRGAADEHAIGFGDDVAAGVGLVARDERGPMFAGDALADPLAGVAAAAAAVAALGGGTGALLDVSMHDVAREAANAAPGSPSVLGDLQAPRHRAAAGRAAALGRDNAEVLD